MTRLSFAQHQIWLSHRLAEPSPLYNVPAMLRLTGPLHRQALAAAIGDVVARHEVLRTVYPETEDGPRQHILDADPAGPPLVTRECQPERLAEAVREAVRVRFDLSVEVPLRSVLFVLGPQEHALLLVLHHIAFDGLSMRPFFRDLERAYAARLDGAAPAWENLPVQYADFAEWQRELLGDESDPGSLVARQLAYWRSALADLPDPLPLPTDRPRAATATFAGGAVPLSVDSRVHDGLIALARVERATMFMVLHTALAALLTRLGAGTDIPIGTPVAGRLDAQLTDLVGCFNNTVVLRGRTGGDPTARELLRRLREADLAALSHQQMPFERVVAALNPPRSAARHPLFQVMLFAESRLAQVGVRLAGLSVRVVPAPSTGTAKLDLTVGFAEQYGPDRAPAGITGVVEYAAALFDRDTAELFAARLGRLLAAMAAHPDTRLSEIDLTDAAERRRLLLDWNDTADPTATRTVPQLIEGQAARTPGAVAVEHGTEQMTYAELNARANRLARHLRALSAGPETVVAIASQPTALVPLAVLAVMKSGAAYLPVDLDSPARRIGFMLADAAASILLADTPPLAAAATPAMTVCRLDSPALVATLARYPDTDLGDEAGPPPPGRAAYVIYTSGSTGTPKGVMVEHHALANYVAWAGAEYRSCRGTTLLHSPIAFDLSVTSLLVPLCHGGSVRVGPLAPEPPGRPRASLVKGTPSHLPVLAGFAAGWEAPDELVMGGEALPAKDIADWRRRNRWASVINEYGPTEATVGCTAFRLDPEGRVPTEARTTRSAVPSATPGSTCWTDRCASPRPACQETCGSPARGWPAGIWGAPA